jgi:hypothetical protein
MAGFHCISVFSAIILVWQMVPPCTRWHNCCHMLLIYLGGALVFVEGKAICTCICLGPCYWRLYLCGNILYISIFAQVNITNPTTWLGKFDVLSCYRSKWRLAVLWKFTEKEISKIKINSVPNNTKDLCKNTKTIIHLRLGDYRWIFTSTSSRRIFPDNHLAFGE